MTTITETAILGPEDGEIEITELEVFDVQSVKGVRQGANGFPHLIMKGIAGDDAGSGGDAEKSAADIAAAAVAKAVVDGKIDQGPDVTLGGQILHLLGQAIINEAQEVSAGAYGEVCDVSLLTDAAGLVRCWLSGEQSTDADSALMQSVADAEDEALGKADRTFTADERKKQAKQGNSLPDGSYPIPDADALRRAAVLARSKHGNWQAAAKLIARRAKELGVPNPMADDDKADASKSTTVAEGAPTVQDDQQGDDGQIAKAVADAVTKATEGPLARLAAKETELDTFLAKVKATPIPGGPVLSANARAGDQRTEQAEDFAAKAALYRQKADDATAPADREGYRLLAREFQDKADKLA